MIGAGKSFFELPTMSNRIVGHESVGSALCGQGRLRAPRGRCDIRLVNTKKAVEYKEHEKLKAGQSTEGEWDGGRRAERVRAEE